MNSTEEKIMRSLPGVQKIRIDYRPGADGAEDDIFWRRARRAALGAVQLGVSQRGPSGTPPKEYDGRGRTIRIFLKDPLRFGHNEAAHANRNQFPRC
jgi:hypothetical protein